MCSQAPGDGRICAKCVLGRLVVAIFSRGAPPPSARRWRDCALMRSWPDWQWQYSRAMRSRVPCRGKIRAPCIRNELALAGYARHASEKPRKPPLEDTPREDLAGKGPFSLHGPLESRIVRRSCHPPPNSASDRSHGAALMGGGTGRGRLLVGRGDAAKGVRGVVGCRALAAKLASVKLRLQVSDADNLAES